MSFPKYPELRVTGDEWLGQLPAHWATPPLYARYEQVLGKMLDQNKFTGIHATPYVRNVDVQWDNVNCDDLPVIDIDPSERDRFTLKTGDLLVCEGGEVGRTAEWKGTDGNVAFQKAIHRLRPLNSNEHPRFFCYVMRFACAQGVFIANSNPNTIPHLTGEQLRLYRFPKPPRDEQVAIAAFLDRETKKIDALVAEQRRLIELLKDKRQAVISQAVTKGLDPTVAMMPTRTGWLGAIPKHWKVMPIKRIVSTPVTDGPHETPQFLDDGVPFVSAEAVSTGRIDFSKIRGFISPEDNARFSQKYSPKPNDIYMVKSGATTGATAIVEDRNDFNIWSPLAVIRCGSTVLPRFALNYFRSVNFQVGLSLNWSFGTQQNIGMGVLQELPCPVPPIDEQREICEQVDAAQAEFHELSGVAETAISLLTERRTALISAAVTGKIDVRHLADSEAA